MTLPNSALQAAQLNQLDLLYRIQDILAAYVIENILLLNQAENSQAITVYDPNLYSLAVQFYGDFDLWTVIASVNGVNDPNAANQLNNTNLTGYVSLLIPPQPATNNGGVLPPPTTIPIVVDPFA